MRVLRYGFTFLALVMGLSAARPAAAQNQPVNPGLPMTTQFTKDDFLIRIQRKEGDGWVFMPQNEAKIFFNRARCECQTPIRATVDLTMTGFAKKGLIGEGTVQMLIGPANCLDGAPQTRMSAHCKNPKGENQGTLFSSLALSAQPAWHAEITVKDLFAVNGKAGQDGTCDAQKQTQKIWLWLPTTNATTPLLTGDAAPQLDVEVDGQAPPAPTGVQVTAGNEALSVSWSRLAGIPDLNGYVVFCSRGGLSVFNDAFVNGRDFHTARGVCKSTMPLPAPMPPANFPTNDAAHGVPILAPDELRGLDPTFACSDLQTSATDARISGLQNGIPYVVGVAAVDRVGNASPIEVAHVQSPILTRDFYRGYREAGGQAEGGFCAYGQRPRPATWAVLLLAAGLALALGRRAGRGRR